MARQHLDAWFHRQIDRRLWAVVRFPLLNGQVALLLLVSWGVVGGELGLEALFWNERVWTQVQVGMAAGLLYGIVLYLNVLLTAPAGLDHPLMPKEPAGDSTWRRPGLTLFPTRYYRDRPVRQVGGWLFWGLLALGAVQVAGKLVAAAVYVASPAHRPDPDPGFGHVLAGHLAARSYGLPFVLGYALGGFVFPHLLFWLDEAFRWFKVGGRGMALRDAIADSGWLRPSFEVPPGAAPLAVLRRDRGLRLLHAIAVYVSVVTAGLAAVAVTLSQEDVPISPAVLLSLTLIMADLIGGVIAFRVRSVRVLGAAALVYLLVVSSGLTGDFRMTFPNLDYPDREADALGLGVEDGTDRYRTEYRGRRADATGHPVGLIDSLDPVRALAGRPPQPGQKPRLVLVAVSGGGIRAAVWTGTVLEGLEREVPGLRDHIRLVTGASGGMVAAGAYAADFDRGGLPQEPVDPDTGLRPFSAALAEDALSPVVQTMILRDFTVTTALPFPRRVRADRGRTLEGAWDKNFCRREPWKTDGPPLARPVYDLWPEELDGRRPSVVFSPVMVEDTKRLLITNLDLGRLTEPAVARPEHPYFRRGLGAVAGGPAATAETVPASLPAVEFFRLFPAADRFAVGTAARASATFPVVSPAVALPVRPVRRLADAGYFDNYGGDLAARWLLAHRKELEELTAGVVLIQVRAYPLDAGGLRFGDEPPDPFTRLVGAVSAPAQAVLTARGSAAHHRDAEFLAEVHRAYRNPACPFVTAVFEMKQPAALSWYLTSAEKRDIAASYDRGRNREAADALREWFGDGWK